MKNVNEMSATELMFRALLKLMDMAFVPIILLVLVFGLLAFGYAKGAESQRALNNYQTTGVYYTPEDL